MADETDRLSAIMALRLRHVVFKPSPPFGSGFLLMGHTNDQDQLQGPPEDVPNFKPGIWSLDVREKSEEHKHQDVDFELCLRWVGDLDDDNQLDFSAGVDDWKAWDKAAAEKSAAAGADWDAGAKWSSKGSYADDGGVLNVISTAYVTEQAVRGIMKGGEDEEDEEEEEELDIAYFLEYMTLNDDATEDGEENPYTIGGIHMHSDSVGCPARIAVAEKDGLVIAVKMFQNVTDDGEDDKEEGMEESTPYESQPGSIKF